MIALNASDPYVNPMKGTSTEIDVGTEHFVGEFVAVTTVFFFPF